MRRSTTRASSLKLFRRIAAAIAFASPVAACGGTTTGDAADAGPDNYNSCGGSHTVSIQYLQCSLDGGTDGSMDVDASDAESDATAPSDAGDGRDGSADAGTRPCWQSCQQACTNGMYGGFASSCSDDGENDAGMMTATCTIIQPCGRRPVGLAAARASKGSSLGRHLAVSAWMEAASVTAFERMADELLAHGAPARLVDAARRAARDEVRHARTMSSLALAHGSRPPSPRVRKRAVRSLAAIARENAVEGCIRETYGAVLATWQAMHAEDAGVRRAMTSIARDERRHAALAMAVASWIEPRLDAGARARLANEKRRTVDKLAREVESPIDPALASAAGLPSPSAAKKLHASLRAAVWS